ncbi:hypothetical protein FNF31_04101 [Cafeteria roenbergensis]|uniref:Uncharacterized protein n=1 Tax=Cafeteria roenbergensis TaxID=33653 RepID=A0A5A8D5X7_CAFRO|nr:hypothetical protein FNF31_04101 [Cafeteria roenbergensis]
MFRSAATRRADAVSRLCRWWRNNRTMRLWRALFRNKAALKALARRRERSAHRVTERLETRWALDLKRQHEVARIMQRLYRARSSERNSPTWQARRRLFEELQYAPRQRRVFLAAAESQELVPFKSARAYLPAVRGDLVDRARRRLRVDVRVLARRIVEGTRAEAEEASSETALAISGGGGAVERLRAALAGARSGGGGEHMASLLRVSEEERRLMEVVRAAGQGGWGLGPFAGMKAFGGAVLAVTGGLGTRRRKQRAAARPPLQPPSSSARSGRAAVRTVARPWSTQAAAGLTSRAEHHHRQHPDQDADVLDEAEEEEEEDGDDDNDADDDELRLDDEGPAEPRNRGAAWGRRRRRGLGEPERLGGGIEGALVGPRLPQQGDLPKDSLPLAGPGDARRPDTRADAEASVQEAAARNRAQAAVKRRARARLRARLVGLSVGAEANALAVRLLNAYELGRAETVLRRRALALGWRTPAMRKRDKATSKAARRQGPAGSGAEAGVDALAAASLAAGSAVPAGGSASSSSSATSSVAASAASALRAASKAGYVESRRDSKAADWEADALTRVWMGGKRPGGLFPALEAEARLVQASLGLANAKNIRGAPGPFGVEGWHFARAVSVRPDEAELTVADIRTRKRIRDLDWERAAGYHYAAMAREELAKTRREEANLKRDIDAMQRRSADMEDALSRFRAVTDELAADVTEHEALARRNEEAQERVLREVEAVRAEAWAACEEGGGVIGADELLALMRRLTAAAGMEEGI